MTLSAFFYALQYFNIKLLHEQHDSTLWPVLFCRGIVGFGVSGVVALARCGWNGQVFWGHAPSKLFARGMLGALSITGSFLGVEHLPLVVAIALLSTTPLWTALLVFWQKTSCFHGDDPIPLWRWPSTIGALVCLTGIVLVSIDSSSFQPQQHAGWGGMVGIVLCLSSSFLNAVVNLTLHDLKDENPWIISMYPMACTMILSAPPAFFLGDVFPKPSLGLWITGVFSLAAQVCRTMALQGTRDMGVVVLRYLDVPFSMMLEILLLKKEVLWTWRTGVGVALVVVGGVVSIGWRRAATT